MHGERSDLTRKVVTLRASTEWVGATKYRVEDWWDRVSRGVSWQDSAKAGNFAALKYAIRVEVENLPIDDEVLYGKIGAFGHLVHVSEVLREVEGDAK